MLGLKVCSDYSRYPIEQRTIYMFHKNDPSCDGAFILDSIRGNIRNIKVRFLSFNQVQIYKKTIYWGNKKVRGYVTFNKDFSPEHEPNSLVFRDRTSGKFLGELSFKLRSGYHSVVFKGFDDFEIMRKSLIDIHTSPYRDRIHTIINDFLNQELA